MKYWGKMWLAVMLVTVMSVGLTGCQSLLNGLAESQESVPDESQLAGFPEEDESGQSGENDSQYREFMDGYKDLYGQERYPALDYDGDGLKDRVYRVSAQDNPRNNELYLLLGSGESLKLGIHKPGESGQTMSADLGGDGVPELIYVHTIWTAAGNTNRISVWERTGAGLSKASLPYTSEKTDGEALLTLPLTLEKLDSTHVRIVQADALLEEILEITEAQMKHVWDGEKNKEIELNISSSTITIETDPETGIAHLCANGLLGDEESGVSVSWELTCSGGQWKIANLDLGVVGQAVGKK